MTPDELDAIEAREKAATPRPWRADGTYSCVWGPDGAAVADHLRSYAGDGPFIAAARSDVPALVADNRRLEAEVRRLRDALRSLMDTWGKSEHDFTDEQSAAQQAAYDALWPNGRPVAEILDDTPDPPDAAKVAKRLARSEAIKAGIDADAMNDAVGVKKPGDGE